MIKGIFIINKPNREKINKAIKLEQILFLLVIKIWRKI